VAHRHRLSQHGPWYNPHVPTTLKDEAKAVIDRLPDDATWDDVLYVIEFRRAVERGLADSRAGRVVPFEEVLREFGLDHRSSG
jgi:hypothetical protein